MPGLICAKQLLNQLNHNLPVSSQPHDSYPLALFGILPISVILAI